MLPCPVPMAVKFGVTFILNFSPSSILGKNAFIIAPFVVCGVCECVVFLIHLFTSMLHY